MASPDSLRPRRRPTVSVDVGGVLVGSAHPVVVQSMTNTDTADADGTAIQVARLAHAGSQLVRVTVNTEAAAAAVPEMVRKVRGLGVDVPIVGDFHYNGHKLLAEYPEMAAALAKYRINPGNVGAKRHDEHFATIIRIANDNDVPVRIGVNWGSLDQAILTELMDENASAAEPTDARDVMIEAMLQSAMRSAELAEATGMRHDRIILSAKVSGVRDLVDVYRLLAARSDYPLHLGLTEAGMGDKGIVASTAGLAILLNEGIGDTIRVSLTPEPGAPREREVEIAQQVLQSMGLRSFLPQVSACPGCGRTTSTFFQEMAQQIQGYLKEQMPVWRETHPGAEELRVAVMGCVVNGPGESKHADIGISLPGTFEEPVAPVFIDGRLDRTLRGDGLVAEFIGILEALRREPLPDARPHRGRIARLSTGRPGVALHREFVRGALDETGIAHLRGTRGPHLLPLRAAMIRRPLCRPALRSTAVWLVALALVGLMPPASTVAQPRDVARPSPTSPRPTLLSVPPAGGSPGGPFSISGHVTNGAGDGIPDVQVRATGVTPGGGIADADRRAPRVFTSSPISRTPISA